MAQLKNDMAQTTIITGSDLFARYGVTNPRTMQWRYKETIGQSFDRNAQVSPDILAQMDERWLPEKGATKEKNPRKSYAKAQTGGDAQQFIFSRKEAQVVAEDYAKEVAQVAPIVAPITRNEVAQPAQVTDAKEAARVDYTILAFCVLCIAIVEVHASLVWYDAFKIWKTWGLFGGAIAFVFQNAGILLASNNKYTDVSEWALFIVGAIDFAAFFLHYPCFKAGSGRSTVDISDIHTVAFCVFVCVFSYASFALFRVVKNR